jgi:hypothetical protein
LSQGEKATRFSLIIDTDTAQEFRSCRRRIRSRGILALRLLTGTDTDTSSLPTTDY